MAEWPRRSAERRGKGHRMSENHEVNEQQEDQEQAQPQAEPNGVAATEPNGKAEEDAEYWKSRSRGWEKQFKELKAERDELSDAKRQAVDEAKRADEAQAALAAANRELAVLKAASAANVDAALLAKMTGDTPEEIAQNAQMLADGIRAAQAYPVVEDKGNQKQGPMTLEDIDAIQDEAQRRKAYAEYYSKLKR